MKEVELFKGKAVSDSIGEYMKFEIDYLRENGVTPKLLIIRVGEREDDVAYEGGIKKKFASLGVEVETKALEKSCDTEDVVRAVEAANADTGVHGVIIMRPLPKYIDDAAVCAALSPDKDVDGITDKSLAGVFAGKEDGFSPCTARACIEILDYYGVELTGKRVAVIGRSLVVGKPVAMMLIKRNATVTVCHTKTTDIKEICKQSDIIIAAAGAPKMVDKSFLSLNQVIIDVGINVDGEGNLCGDVDFEACKKSAFALSPVPGGVGTVTSAVLARSVVYAAKRAARL